MLRLQHISLVQFRNYLQQSFTFNQRVVGICGLNGSGKTNLLDAIYYLSFTKSYFARPDAQSVHHGLAGMRIQGDYDIDGDRYKLVSILRENNRKEFSVNDEEYKKFSDHIGRFPCVMIAPDDVELITGSSEERRKLADTILSQINKTYLQQLIQYTKLLQQRNSLLKQAVETGYTDEALLDILSAQLSEKGDYIYAERKQFFTAFLPLINTFYQKIANGTDELSLKYESPLQQADMKTLLQQSRQKDFALQRTTTGIHKDDIVFQMGNATFKAEASQGQRKSLLFALKLAEWKTLKEQKAISPILLLDDVFEKLDQQRMHNLLHWVCNEDDGQVFITDTHADRLENALTTLDIEHQLINLS